MAGHSHFKNIMVRKGAQDKRRAKQFSKVAREITVATKTGANGDPETNPRLRLAIAKAREVNMPNDRIKRAIEQGMPGGGDDANYEEVRYEGYACDGIAVIIEALTDNRTRTVAEVRTAFVKAGGAMGDSGSVAFMFERIGEIVYPLAKASPDAMFEAAVECGAQNVESEDDFHRITCAPEDFGAVRAALETKFGAPAQSALIFQALNKLDASFETAQKVMKLVETLEDNDDVQAVFTTMDVSDAVAAQLEAA